MQSNSPELPNSQQGLKVAIPRLNRAPPPPPKSIERTREARIGRACTACRKRKVKCSGELPRCSNCQTSDLECSYQKARGDRLREATQLNHSLVALLQDLSERIGNEDKQRIDDTLRNAANIISSHATTSPLELEKRGRRPSTGEDDDQVYGEAFVTASARSNENLDHLDEDLMRDHESRATGYVGMNSEVQWLRSAQRQTEDTGAEPYGEPHGPPGSTQNAASARSDALHVRRDDIKEQSRQGSMKYMNDSTFYLDSDDIEMDTFIDPYEDPDPDVGERLFDCYWETVQPFFPLVPQTFADRFRKYLSALRYDRPYQVPIKWRTQMNLLLAIGAKHSHLIDAEWRGDNRDHLTYMTRAVHLLGLKNTVMIISAPDLELVQVTGTLAFYFLVIGHVSRAWIMIGISIRLGLALGLHLRNEDPEAGDARKELLAHTWWSLYSTEALVSTITGRPPVIALEDCTVSLPRSFSREQEEQQDSGDASGQPARRRTRYNTPQTMRSSNTSETSHRVSGLDRYLLDHTNITIISQKVLLELYSPRTATGSWESVQAKITALLNELEEWSKAAIRGDYQDGQEKHKTGFEREQFLLMTEYWSTKMLITRPCLCRIERRIRDESSASAVFNKTRAETCVKAALEMVKLFPDEPDLDFIYSKGPWWVAVHLIMQSIAVLLLEMAYRNRDMENSDLKMAVSIKKAIRWLRAMQHNDPVAARAYHVIWKILKRCAPVLQSQVDGILALYGEEIPQSRAHQHQHHHVPYRAQQTAQVPQGDFHFGPMDTSGTSGLQPLQDYPLDNIPAYQGGLDPFYPPDDHVPSMPFGNLFLTNFDHGVPLVNMQDLWIQPWSSNVSDPYLSHVDTSQGGYGVGDGLTAESPLQQQQFDDHPPRG